MLPYIHIFSLKIPSYGLCMAFGIILAFLYAFKASKKYSIDISTLIITAVCPLGFGLIGAKLLYILVTYRLSDLIQQISAGDFSALTSDGLVFYGGLIGGFLGFFVGLLISKQKIHPFDRIFAPCIPLGHAFGRIGCFMSGCCYGIKYDGFLSVTFPLVGVNEPVLPIQLIEAILNICIFLVLAFLNKRSKYSPLPIYFLMYSVVRFTLEFFRGDEIRGIFFRLSTSQWISVGIFICSIVAVIINVAKNRRTA